jgi:hypothetical protein
MEKQMTNLTRIASLALVALLAGTSLASAVNVVDVPVLVDVYEPPVDITPDPPVDDHDLNDGLFDNGPIDDHDLSDGLFDDDKELADLNLLLSCRIVDGELLITNEGDPIPAGTKVKWKAAGETGTVLLPNGLRADQKARIDVSLGVETGKCTADVVL